MNVKVEAPVETVSATEPAAPVVNRSAKILELESALFNKEAPVATEEPKVEEPVVAAPVVPAETKAEEPTVDPVAAKEDEFTKRFAQLSKMEAQLRTREEKLKEHQAAMTELEQLRELKTLAKSDPLKVVESLGISINDLAEQTINQDSFNEKKSNNDMAERLRKLEEMTTKQKELEAKTKEEQLAQEYVNKVVANINAKAEQFPLVKELSGGVQLVINTISEYYQRTGEELPWDRAAQMTEDYLTDQKLKEFEQLSKIDKIKSKFSLTTPPKSAEAVPTQPTKSVLNTISNKTASAPAAKDVGKITKEERERRIRELSDRLWQ